MPSVTTSLNERTRRSVSMILSKSLRLRVRNGDAEAEGQQYPGREEFACVHNPVLL